MNQQLFESRVLELWMKTRVPLTRANLLYYTHAPRKKLERWLDAMVAEGVLEVDADDEGEMIWGVRGAVRAKDGATSVDELTKLQDLDKQATETRGAIELVARSAGLAKLASVGRNLTGGAAANKPGDKSVLASGALSLVFGPLGWLYAAPLKEAVPAIGIYMLLMWLPLIHFLFVPLLPVVHLICGLAGAGYAWRHNQTGTRTSLAPTVKRVLPAPKPKV